MNQKSDDDICPKMYSFQFTVTFAKMQTIEKTYENILKRKPEPKELDLLLRKRMSLALDLPKLLYERTGIIGIRKDALRWLTEREVIGHALTTREDILRLMMTTGCEYIGAPLNNFYLRDTKVFKTNQYWHNRVFSIIHPFDTITIEYYQFSKEAVLECLKEIQSANATA